jgi:hypothetical protein
MTISLKKLDFFIITPIFILLSHYLAVYLHEYAHSFMAFLLGYKQNPFDIHYGGKSLLNIFLLINIDQNVDYNILYSFGHTKAVALIAAAGPLMNGILFFVSLWLLKNRKTIRRFYRYYFLLLFALMNLGNVYDYIPIRTFATEGKLVDVLDIERAINLSPWWIYAIIGYVVAYMIWVFFTKTLVTAYADLKLNEISLRAGLMIVCVCILFGYFGLPGFFSDGTIPYFLSFTSLWAIPGIIVILWPTHHKLIKKY